MKRFLCTILFFIVLVPAFARHIKGGFFTYEYLGAGTAANTLRYKITLTMYIECPPHTSGQISNPINFTIFNGNTSIINRNISVGLKSEYEISKVYDEPCISGNSEVDCYYTILVYELSSIDLPVSTDGYTISYQRCCRIENMENISFSDAVGNTYTIKIPGVNSPVPNAEKNSSPLFPINDTIVVCQNSYFTYSFQATDKDGDSLSYSFCDAFLGASQAVPGPEFSTSPPYTIVPYTNGYSGSNPLGTQVSIDSRTGLMSGIAPPIRTNGEYVITVCISEYRNGIYFTDSKKELHVKVKNCEPLRANLGPDHSTCDGFTQSFKNLSANPTGTLYSWEFGDPSTGTADTSTLAEPIHTFSDTGIFKVKLRVSVANGLCSDSTTLSLGVYPGFFPALQIVEPFCLNAPVQFRDISQTLYGSINSWRWDFGDPAATNDTSRLRNPTYTYIKTGPYNITFTVGSSKGCIGTLTRAVTILNNPGIIVSPKDTTYCALDNVQLSAQGSGSFSWLPATNITSANTATPTVSPKTTTTYVVTLTSNGCIAKDSVILRPLNDLVTTIDGPGQICEEDKVTLTATSNHSPVTFRWTPAGTLSATSGNIVEAFPVNPTTYTLLTKWGRNCSYTTTKSINVKALAVANAGSDVILCLNQGLTQLNATGGEFYNWTPGDGLSSTTISNPIANPVVTTTYKVEVGVTGCPKTREDEVVVTVTPPPLLTKTNDTLICAIDTLRLFATGNGNVVWSPDYNINNLTSKTPSVSPDLPTRYNIELKDANGCITNGSVFVDVRPFITIDAGKDTTICQTDAITLKPVSDALQYDWSPATGLSNNKIKNPIATPLSTQTYHVLANLGKCAAEDDVTITVVPYPAANAGNDVSVCYQTPVQLQATGGSIYSWSPSTFLSATDISNPMVRDPTDTVQYVVTVTDNLGCPKAVKDTVIVNVSALVVADAGPTDTLVVVGQPLELNGSGGDIYTWSPSTGLDNPNIPNPIAKPQSNITYKLQVKTLIGCTSSDSINVKVYNVIPDLYVPTAFTPGTNDALNSTFKPILIGMKSLHYFRIYNRWGQLVFQTNQNGKGWDGRYKGSLQAAGTYVWVAEGVTYTNAVTQKKGYVVLIR